jgi:serine/threonine protein kinase
MTADTRILGAPKAGTVKNGPAFVADLPKSIAGYTLVKAIGQGGMGCVYEVRHDTLGKHFALKLLSESLRDNVEAVERFRCETLALGKLDHPNIVTASDAGVWQGRPFLVTELLKGQDLSSRVSDSGQLDRESVMAIAEQLSDALGFAHEHGYFHRDIKPSNVFYLSDGSAKLLDFGLVRCASNHSLTQTGTLMGTVDFVAPEQACDASQANAASDIYSFGCTLIYLLSGEVPFPDRRYPSLAEKLHAQLHDTPSWLNQAKDEHPRWLLNLIQAMVAKRPSERPASCQIIQSSLKTRSFAVLQPASTHEPTTPRYGFNSGKRLAIGSAIAVTVGASTLIFKSKIPEGWSQVPAAAAQMRPANVSDDNIRSHYEQSGQSQSTTATATQSEEKTLPVSITHNARGTPLQILKLGKNSAESNALLSKDVPHE